MKNKILKFTLYLLVLIIGFLGACQISEREFESCSQEEINASVADASELYQNLVGDRAVTRMYFEFDGAPLLIKPQWEKPQVKSNKDYLTVEFSLLSEKPFNFCFPDVSQGGEYRCQLSKSRFVYLRYRNTDDKYMFIMTIIPSAKYIKDTNFKPFRKNRYLEIDKEFCGLIFYHELNGMFANGWKYENGEITEKICDAFPFIETSTTRGCVDNTVNYITTECYYHDTYYESGGSMVYLGSTLDGCTDSYSSYTYTTCDGGGNIGNSGGSTGGGGYIPPSDPQKELQKRIDEARNPINMVSNTKVLIQFNKAWTSMTVSASQKMGRRETGCWIYFNKETGEYVFGKIKYGEYVKGRGSHGSISIGAPSASADELGKECVPLTFIHVHTTLHCESHPDLRREVGPSPIDIKYAKEHSATLILIDYVGNMDSETNKFIITPSDPLDAEKAAYIFDGTGVKSIVKLNNK